GRDGIVALAELMLQRAAYARERLSELDGVSLLHEHPVVREFALAIDAPVEPVIDRCLAAGINPGYPLARDYAEYSNGLLVAITQRGTGAETDPPGEALGGAMGADRSHHLERVGV